MTKGEGLEYGRLRELGHALSPVAALDVFAGLDPGLAADSGLEIGGEVVARYRKIDSRIWNDEKFRSLSDDGQLVFLFLLTHPHQTALGAMRSTIPGLASEKGWAASRLLKAFNEALSKGIVQHDERAACIWLPNFLRYNGPESPNVVRGWGSAVDLIPECAIRVRAVAKAKDFLEGYSPTFTEAFTEAFGDYYTEGFDEGCGHPMPNPEPEPKPEPNKKASGVALLRILEPPDGLDLEAWARWIAYRTEIRHPLKSASFPAAQRALAKFGIDQAAAVEQSIANGWQGLFAPKNGVPKPRERGVVV